MNQDEPLTLDEKLKVFVAYVENNESIYKNYLPELSHFKVEREITVAVAEFIKSEIIERELLSLGFKDVSYPKLESQRKMG